MNELTQKVQTALLDDPRTNEANIEILNENGVITLSGLVDSENTSQAAETLTKDVTGVVTVVNELQVRKGDNDSRFGLPGTYDEDTPVE